MKRLILSLSAASAVALAAGAAQAQSWESSYSRQSREERCDCYDYGARRDVYAGEHHGHGYHDAPAPAGASYYGAPSGGQNNMGYFEQYAPGRSAFRPGLLLPPYFRGYMVTDNRLARKRGYAWYRVGNEYILASTSSGEVMQIVTFP